jgi:hypothetical protein
MVEPASRRQRFRQHDVTAAIKGVEAAGHGVARIEIERDGRIILIVTRPDDDVATQLDGEERWDAP